MAEEVVAIQEETDLHRLSADAAWQMIQEGIVKHISWVYREEVDGRIAEGKALKVTIEIVDEGDAEEECCEEGFGKTVTNTC